MDQSCDLLASLGETLLQLYGTKHYVIPPPPEDVELRDGRCQYETPQLAFRPASASAESQSGLVLTKDAYTEDTQTETREHVDDGINDEVATCIYKGKGAVVERRQMETGSVKSVPSTFVTKASRQTG